MNTKPIRVLKKPGEFFMVALRKVWHELRASSYRKVKAGILQAHYIFRGSKKYRKPIDLALTRSFRLPANLQLIRSFAHV
jgi:hypothetical protein